MDMRTVKHIRMPRLPKEYQEVEYLETHADGHIDSGYAFTEPELKVEFKYMKLDALNNNLFGVDRSDTTGAGRMLHGNIYSQNVYCGNGGRAITFEEGKQEVGKICEGNVRIVGTAADEQQMILTINGGSQTFVNSQTNLFSGCPMTDYVFATRLNEAGRADYLFKGRLYYLRFFGSTGAMVRSFIPCCRKSDGAVGLYDFCGSICPQTGTPFYINLGSGTFQKGADVVGGFVKQIHCDGTLLWEESQ